MANLIFKGLNEVLRIEKQKYITNNFKAYIIKEPTLYQWVQIKSIDYDNLPPMRILKELVSIMIPKINVDDLEENQLLKIGNECIEIFNNGLLFKEHNKNSQIDENNKSQDEIYINLNYLILKCCKFTNMNYKEILDLNVFIFFDIISSIQAIEAEEALRMAEIFDNHLHLQTKNKEKYKETLNKYSKDFKEKGIKVVKSFDPSGLNKLKAMLGGAL